MSDAIDPAAIDSLRQLFGDEPSMLDELIHAFLADTPTRLDTIDRAVERKDPDALATAAHTLKSSAANMGAIRLSGLCRELEDAARRGEEDGLMQLATQVRLEFEAARDALAALRSG